MQTLSLSLPFQKAFDLSTKALDSLGIKYKADKRNKTINATKGVSLFSWGEEIQISFEDKLNKTVVKIESISPGQLISWGRNESNEGEIVSEIKNLSKHL